MIVLCKFTSGGALLIFSEILISLFKFLLEGNEKEAINTYRLISPSAPFGGIKQSGYGREGGSMAIKDYLNVKYTHLGIKG